MPQTWNDDGILDVWPKRTVPVDYNPKQKQIEFFWPLTEQIELDLDYTRTYDYDYEKTQSRLTAQEGQVLTIANGNTSAVWMSTNDIQTAKLTVTTEGIETPEITFTLNKKPFIIKRMMYNLLGFKWKIK